MVREQTRVKPHADGSHRRHDVFVLPNHGRALVSVDQPGPMRDLLSEDAFTSSRGPGTVNTHPELDS